MRIIAVAGLLTLLSGAPFAQQPTNPQAPTDKASFMSAADLTAALAKLPKDRPNASVRVFTLGTYTVNVEQRQPAEQNASQHDDRAELFHVLDGSAVMLTGGTMPNATRNGANLSGKTIEGGTRQPLNKGDFFLVPSGVPHQFVDVKGIHVMTTYFPKQ